MRVSTFFDPLISDFALKAFHFVAVMLSLQSDMLYMFCSTSGAFHYIFIFEFFENIAYYSPIQSHYGDVKFTYLIMVGFLPLPNWHYEYQQVIEGIKNGWGDHY